PKPPPPPPTPRPAPPPTPRPAPPPADGIIHSDGSGHLTLNGARYQFTGVNAFELATWWGTNSGCGAEIDDLDGFFNSLTPNNVVRFWAFQDFTRSKSTGKRDWGPIDRVVQSAERTHQRLLFVLGARGATCRASSTRTRRSTAAATRPRFRRQNWRRTGPGFATWSRATGAHLQSACGSR